MKRRFIINLILLLTLNLLIKPFWILGIDRVVQNRVGAEAYGLYFAIFNFSFLFNILLDVGITNFNNRNVAQNNQLLQKHFSRIVGLKFLLGVFYAIITLLLGVFVRYDAYQMKLLLIMVFNQFLISFVLYLRSNVSALLQFGTDSVLSVLDRFLMIIFCGILLWGNVTDKPFQIEWFIYSQTAAYVITALVALTVVIRKSGFKRIEWNLPFFVLILKQSFPFAILALLMTFYNRIDSVMIERILPKDEGALQAGYYASAYRLLDASNMIAYLFSVLLLPMFAKMIKEKLDVESLARLAFTLLFLLSTTVAVMCFVYAHDIMAMLYPNSAEESAAVFRWLMICFVPVSSSYVFGTLLTANANMKQLNIIAASGMVFNIAVNLAAIPLYKAIGSAVCSVATQLITNAIQIYFVFKIFKFNAKEWAFLRLLLYVVIAALLCYVLRLGFSNWVMAMFVAGIGCVVAAFALRLVDIKAMLALIKKSDKFKQ